MFKTEYHNPLPLVGISKNVKLVQKLTVCKGLKKDKEYLSWSHWILPIYCRAGIPVCMLGLSQLTSEI
jgi:hypothetical protein